LLLYRSSSFFCLKDIIYQVLVSIIASIYLNISPFIFIIGYSKCIGR